ncbi:MAG TPA: transcriptional regulator, partial [Gemmataceae bacterium]|nr:transcriptional regulator [Gemmataceae bacterium]
AQRQTHQVLLDAVAVALGASDSVSQSLADRATKPEAPPSPAILDQLRTGLQTTGATAADSHDSVELAEAIRSLAVRHGAPAVQHCIRLVESLRQLLDNVAGS